MIHILDHATGKSLGGMRAACGADGEYFGLTTILDATCPACVLLAAQLVAQQIASWQPIVRSWETFESEARSMRITVNGGSREPDSEDM